MGDRLGPSGTDALALGELSQSTGFLLRLAQLVSFRDFFDDLGGLGIRPGETSVLMLIGENPGVRQGVLARALMIKRAHMAKMMAAMERDGLVIRSVPDDDRRSVALRLSEKGQAHVARVCGPFAAHEARAQRGLSGREVETLRRLLRKFAGVTDPEVRR